jgi:photosystem II stability/assembly factor-like uncharacterized protein
MEQRRVRTVVTGLLVAVMPLAAMPVAAQTDLASARVCDAEPMPVVPFPDVASDSTFCVEIAELATAGITLGRTDGTFGPGEGVTRGATAALLYRFLIAAEASVPEVTTPAPTPAPESDDGREEPPPPLDALSGDPDALAATAVPDVDFQPRPQDYDEEHPELDGIFVSFNTLLLTFAMSTTVGEANAILAAIGAQIVGGVPGVDDGGEAAAGILILRVPTTDHGAIIALLDDLRAEAAVDNVVQDALLEETVLPALNDGDPDDWTWEIGGSGGNWGLEHIRVPQMWNLNGTIEAAGPHPMTTGVLDTGFADSHPDLPYTFNATPGRQGDHGTHVAGTIGATFDNGIGVDGVNPYANLIVRKAGDGCTRSTDTALAGRESFGEAVVCGLRGLILSDDDMRAVNISMGYNFGPARIIQNTNVAAQELVASQAVALRQLFNILRFETEVPLIVAAAGNDSASGFGVQDARWASPYTYAALELPPPPGFVRSPILVVESIRNTGWYTATRSGFSNTGGHLSAPGSGITSTTYDSTGGRLYEAQSGTSMAAPHVTGLAGYLFNLDPTLTRDQMIELLTHPANNFEIDGGAAPSIDAYLAALAIDRVQGDDRIRRALLDVNGDGQFDELDIAAFVTAFDQYDVSHRDCSVAEPGDEADCPIFSRYDLNGLGYAGHTSTVRFDLDRDGSYDLLTRMIEGVEVRFDERALSDLQILCYYAYSPLYEGEQQAASELPCTQRSWFPLATGEPNAIAGIAFADADRGVTVTNQRTGQVRVTSNGGQSWETREVALLPTLNEVIFTDSGRAWAAGSGAIVSSSDYGDTWATASTSIGPVDLWGIDFVGVNTGWAVGSNATIVGTTDAGVTWSQQPAPAGLAGTTVLRDVAFADDALTGWIVGAAGTILASADGGITWVQQASGTTSELRSVTVADGSMAWAVGDNGTILSTTDGGTTWTPQASGTQVRLNALSFVDATRGWVVGHNGTVLTTADGGANWFPQRSDTTQNLLNVTFLTATRGWATSSNTIYTYR